MNRPTLDLQVLPGTHAVCRLGPEEPIPAWALAPGGFASFTRTREELSVLCEDRRVPEGIPAERGFRILKVRGPLDFVLTGVLASLADPLATAGISLFAVSTFDTDYVLVRAGKLAEAIAVLRAAGHRVALD